MSNTQSEPFEPVIACNPTAIAPADRPTHVATAEEIFSASTVLAIKELAQGYAFRLPLSTAMLDKTFAYIANERLCCPFFTFTLVVGSELWLELSGTGEVKEYIKSNIVPMVQEGRFPTLEQLEAAYPASARSGGEGTFHADQ
jgi:hypothetical protein